MNEGFRSALNAVMRSTPEGIYRNGDRAFDWPGEDDLEQENENEKENEERE